MPLRFTRITRSTGGGGVEVTYQGYDITEWAQVRRCVSRDTAGDRCDSLDIEFENAAGWYGLEPKEDDQIIVSHNGYDTGVMYVNTVLPEDGRFRIFASSLPCSARAKGYQSFTGKTIEEIMRACAMNSGMGFQIFGIDGNTVIPYIQRENEGCAAFLYRLLRMEGAALKCVNGMYTAIGIEYAQAREAHQTIEVTADQAGMEYRRSGQTYRLLTLETPYASATAQDTSVPTNHGGITINDAPARDAVQAGRWARGILLDENRKRETLVMSSAFNAGYTSMTRIDATGSSDTVGEWLIQEAEHDFIELKSTATMHRCITSIQ